MLKYDLLHYYINFHSWGIKRIHFTLSLLLMSNFRSLFHLLSMENVLCFFSCTLPIRTVTNAIFPCDYLQCCNFQCWCALIIYSVQKTTHSYLTFLGWSLNMLMMYHLINFRYWWIQQPNKRANKCCFTLSDQLISYIIVRTSYISIRWCWCTLFTRSTYIVAFL